MAQDVVSAPAAGNTAGQAVVAPAGPVALAQLLAVEDDEALMAPACPVTGIALWTLLRTPLFRLVMSDLLYASQPLLSTQARMPLARIARGALRSMAHNLAHRPRKSQLLVRASGVGLIEREGRIFNRYVDYFAGEAPGGAWSFEDLASWNWPGGPRQGHVSYTTAAFTAIRLRAQATVTTAHRDAVQQLVDRALARAARLLGWHCDPARRDWLVAQGARRLAALPLQRALARRWLARVQPTVFLVEEGCYGPMAAFNLAAREAGVVVAEFQHGAVTAGHDVYNVAPAVAASGAFRRSLPDVFLGWGSWWNEQFNLPIDKRVIGNPHREAILAATAAAPAQGPRQVLILGDGRELDAHLGLCRELVERLPRDWAVVFRPHPEERSHVRGLPAAVFDGFALDTESDIYVSLSHAEAVVAELSTGLFDGVGLARRIFVWDTPKSRFGLPSHPFARFADAPALAAALQLPQAGGLSADQQASIWAPGWRARFREFLASCNTAGAA